MENEKLESENKDLQDKKFFGITIPWTGYKLGFREL